MFLDETLHSFEQIVEDVAPRLGGGNLAALGGHYRLLLLLIWLRAYPTQAELAILFGVQQPDVCRELQHALPILADYVDGQVRAQHL